MGWNLRGAKDLPLKDGVGVQRFWMPGEQGSRAYSFFGGTSVGIDTGEDRPRSSWRFLTA